MKTRIVCRLGWLAPAVLVACASPQPKPAAAPQTVTAQLRSGSSELRTYQILDWIAPDDRTLIVSSVDRSLLRARFKGRCNGLRLADTLAFIVQTPPQVEKYAGIVLPDGTRCAFTSMTRLETDGVATGKP